MLYNRLVSGAAALLALAALCLGSAHALAQTRLAGPFTHDNMSIYLVHDKNAASTMMTLDEAMARGVARVHWASDERTMMVDNMSGQDVFIQHGTLLTGGTQDQVVANDQIITAGAIGIPLATFCVERGRSHPRTIAREGENATRYTTAGRLIPSRGALLSLMAGSADSRPARRLRQIGVWLGAEQVRRQVAERVGTPAEGIASPTSLPLALENSRLVAAQQEYVEALAQRGEAEGDIVGVVFAVNGALQTVDIYSSNALFRRM